MVALLSFCGTGIGTLGGILTANKLTNYRIQELEKKVDKHNSLIERMVVVEQSTKSAHHRIDEIAEKLGGM
jgi:cell division protein FtsL